MPAKHDNATQYYCCTIAEVLRNMYNSGGFYETNWKTLKNERLTPIQAMCKFRSLKCGYVPTQEIVSTYGSEGREEPLLELLACA